MSRGRLGNLTLLFCGNVYQKVFIFFLCFRKRASCFLIYIPGSVVFTSCFLYKEKKLILLLMFSWFIKSTRRKTSKHKSKELSLCHKLKSSGHNIFATWWCKPLIFQILIILSLSINSLKYLRSTKLGYKDIEIRKSEFVAKTQLLSL